MKRLLILAALAFIPALASAQEAYTVNATAGQVTRLTKAVTIQNRQTCAQYGFIPACTQAQVCVQVNAAGGASCTAAQARASNVRIYPNTQPGREEFVTFALVVPAFQQLMATAVSTDQADFCAAFKAAAPATQNSTCATFGLAAACEPCQ
jgi:hypothetical protein